MSIESESDFVALVRKAEQEAEEDQRGYLMKLGLFAVLGYVVIFALLALLLGLTGGMIATAFFSTGLFLLLLKKKLLFLILPAIWMLLQALWVKFEKPAGMELKREDYPELFEVIDDLTEQLDALKIHTVVLDWNLNAAVDQHPRLGVLGWHRNYLILGYQLLLTLSPEEMRSVLAHEFGHLSGNHSRFAGWIYRVRISWQRILHALEERDGFGAGLMRRFFNWYSPQFDAYSFALARQNEYEADAISAELTSKETATRALVFVHATAPYVDENYWRAYFKHADENPEPPHPPLEGLTDFLANQPIDRKELLQRIKQEMSQQTHYADTHPSLKDRVDALGALPQLPAPPVVSAAQAWLGDRNKAVMAEFDRRWMLDHGESWKQRYEYCSNARKFLEENRDRPLDTLNDEDLWQLAYWVYEFDTVQASAPLFEEYRRRKPEDPDAAYFLALDRFAEKDMAGMELLREALKNGHSIEACANEGYGFLKEQGREEDAEAWWQECVAAQGKYDEAMQELNNIQDGDTFRYAQIDDDMREDLCQKVLGHAKVKNAWIAEKPVEQTLIDLKVYVVAITLKGLASSAEKVMEEVAELLTDVKAVVYVVAKTEGTAGIFKKVRKLGDPLGQPPGQGFSLVGNSSMSVLVLLLLAAAGLYLWQNILSGSSPAYNIPMAAKGALVGPASHTGVDSLEVLDVNFWEAKVKVTYSLEQRHGNGYVALHMTENGWHSNVGLKTAPGQSRGVALLSRHENQPAAYKISKVRAQMYDPYRRDRNYYEKYLPIDIDWPGAETLGIDRPPNTGVFDSVKSVHVFRNVPSYIDFNKRLVEQGVPPEIIDLSLAICRNCAGSVIFGEGVPVAAVQAVIRALAIHDFPLDRIEFSQLERHEGVIHIGQTPTDQSKAYWSFHEDLIADDVSRDEFFKLIGFPQPPAADQAIALHQRAKALIDNSGRSKDLKRAGTLLERAVALDSGYIPNYIEMARLQTRTTSGFDPRAPSESARQSISILKNAIKIDPEYANIYVLLGYYQTAMQQFPEAKASFQRARELGTDNLWLYANESIWYELHEQPELAMTALERVAEHELNGSDNDRALRWSLDALAGYYVGMGRYGDAQNTFERLMEDFPGKNSTLRDYAYFLSTYTDQYIRLSEVVAEATRRGCACEKDLKALQNFVDAGRTAPQDRNQAVRMLVQAQSGGLSVPPTAAQLSMGGAGRVLLGNLVPDIVSMDEIEEQGSILILLLDIRAAEPRKFFLEMGASPNQVEPSIGASPLMLAVYIQNAELVKEFMQYGGDPLKETDAGVSAMKLAKDANNKEILALLTGGKV